MSIVDKLLYRYERLDGDIDEMVPASLARELEVHCEAMALFADDHWPGCECAGCSYLAWKEKRMNSE